MQAPRGLLPACADAGLRSGSEWRKRVKHQGQLARRQALPPRTSAMATPQAAANCFTAPGARQLEGKTAASLPTAPPKAPEAMPRRVAKGSRRELPETWPGSANRCQGAAYCCHGVSVLLPTTPQSERSAPPSERSSSKAATSDGCFCSSSAPANPPAHSPHFPSAAGCGLAASRPCSGSERMVRSRAWPVRCSPPSQSDNPPSSLNCRSHAARSSQATIQPPLR